ncbi:hypothetical protein [Streptomyces sp. NPDC048188]|uniref:hypothetical protein n=1 Tax=Streptomyces sp. NPDC048188 TaxID=3155749 RepID=UPI00342F0283
MSLETDAADARTAFLASIGAYDLAEVETLRQTIDTAVFELLDLCDRYNRTIDYYVLRLGKFTGHTSVPVGAHHGNTFGDGGPRVTVDGTAYTKVDGMSLLKATVHAARQRQHEAGQTYGELPA